MNINKFKRLLAERGFSYSRRGKGSHEIWVNENGESFHSHQPEKKFISELYGTSEETIVTVKSCIYFWE